MGRRFGRIVVGATALHHRPGAADRPTGAGRTREFLGHHDLRPQCPQRPGNPRPAGRLSRDQFEIVLAVLRKTGDDTRAHVRREAPGLAINDAVNTQSQVRRRTVHAEKTGDAVRAGFVHAPGKGDTVGAGLGGQPGQEAGPVERRRRPRERNRRQHRNAPAGAQHEPWP